MGDPDQLKVNDSFCVVLFGVIEMGCVYSSIDNEEKVVRCKERKKLMRQVVSSRHEFAVSQMAYLQALRNAGATLRQFAELESVELQKTSPYPHLRHYRVTLPPSPPPFPPPPPPPPPLSLTPSPSYGSATFPTSIPVNRASTDVRISNAQPSSPPKNSTSEQQWNTPHDSDTETPTPPPPPPQGSAWDFWDPFCASSPARISDRRAPHTSENELKKQQQQQQQQQQQLKIEEEQWDETVTEFDDDQETENSRLTDKSPGRETDDNSSMVSWYTKDTDLAMVISRKHKNLGEIVGQLDEYFLKASEGGKEVSEFLDASKAYLEHDLGKFNKNSYRSAKVFSALSWSWSLKSPLVCKDTVGLLNTGEPYSQGSHCATLERLCAWEKKLYEKVRNRESAKITLQKKMRLLRSQQSKGYEETKINKTRRDIEMLQCYILQEREDVITISASILNLKENQLYPQLVELSEGLMRMWRSMYECHLVQNHIAQQVNQLQSLPSTETTSDYHQLATIQLENEVSKWYTSFCAFVKSQRNYMQTLSGWMKLSLHQLENGMEGTLETCPPYISTLVEEWQQALDRLPVKAASEAIKSFITIVHEIVVQQAEEQKHRKKSERLYKRLEKKEASLQSLERKYCASTTAKSKETPNSGLDPKDPLAQKRAKIDAFKRKVEDEKLKHLNSIRTTRARTLKNLQTWLPTVFQAMTSFSSACMQEFEAVHNQSKSFRF